MSSEITATCIEWNISLRGVFCVQLGSDTLWFDYSNVIYLFFSFGMVVASMWERERMHANDKKLHILERPACTQMIRNCIYYWSNISSETHPKVSTRSVRTIYKKLTKSSLPKYHKQRCDVLGLAFIQFYL